MLLRKTVQRAWAIADGSLELMFSDTVVSVTPAPAYEAWEFQMPEIMVISQPGGGLAIFGYPE